MSRAHRLSAFGESAFSLARPSPYRLLNTTNHARRSYTPLIIASTFICHRCLPRNSLVTSYRSISSTSSRRGESLAPQTHYDFFPETLPSGPPPAGPFDIDIRALRREFLQKQATAHPDRHPGDLKRRAEALSARINEAYKTLQDPLSRAQYILSLHGIDVAEDETAKVDDAELLMQVLETREVIEDATTEADLQNVKDENDVRLEESVAVLDRAFKEDDMQTAKIEAVKLRYWVNIRESVQNWEPGKPVVLIH